MLDNVYYIMTVNFQVISFSPAVYSANCVLNKIFRAFAGSKCVVWPSFCAQAPNKLTITGLILGLHLANERRCYFVTP